MWMGFRVGFVAGCAVGVWAAAKAGQLQRLGVEPAQRWPGSVSSRAAAVNAEVTAEKLRAIGDLARERVTGLVGERATAKQDRIATLLGSSLREDPHKAPNRWPINVSRHSA